MIFVSIIALALCGDHLSIIPTKSGAQQCTGSSLDIIIIIIIIATSMSAVVVEISPRPNKPTISHIKLTLIYVLKKKLASQEYRHDFNYLFQPWAAFSSKKVCFFFVIHGLDCKMQQNVMCFKKILRLQLCPTSKQSSAHQASSLPPIWKRTFFRSKCNMIITPSLFCDHNIRAGWRAELLRRNRDVVRITRKQKEKAGKTVTSQQLWKKRTLTFTRYPSMIARKINRKHMISRAK